MATDTEDVGAEAHGGTTSAAFIPCDHCALHYEALQRVADYWYFRAQNPGKPSPEARLVESIIAGKEANEERARKFAELDAAEEKLFDEARVMISEGFDDITTARKVGLFVGIVKNIRAGVL